MLTSVLLLGFFAHDFWIEPGTFSPTPGQIVGVRLRVGQDLLGDPVPRDPGLVERFVVEDASGARPLVGRDGADPAGLFRTENAGLTAIGYLSRPSAIEISAQKFDQYLKEEGLDAIAAMRAKVRTNGRPVREAFSRCAKSLLVSGAPAAAQTDRALGLTLELIAERNPYTMRPGDELPLRLLYKARPIAGVLVVAMNRLNPSEKLGARTGIDGRARIRLPRGGMWLIKAVHMIPAPAGADAEWASFWASLTFEVPDATRARK